MVQQGPQVDPGPARLQDLVDQLDKVQDVVVNCYAYFYLIFRRYEYLLHLMNF